MKFYIMRFGLKGLIKIEPIKTKNPEESIRRLRGATLSSCARSPSVTFFATSEPLAVFFCNAARFASAFLTFFTPPAAASSAFAASSALASARAAFFAASAVAAFELYTVLCASANTFVTSLSICFAFAMPSTLPPCSALTTSTQS